ncbi:hypothetical protein [Actinoplanes sp. NPDC049265]|uniref:hypothetical protein n=1 Tax=Actinoplanes sp. NPDC049265 TaxID=3363902 RepID=UPI00371AF377
MTGFRRYLTARGVWPAAAVLATVIAAGAAVHRGGLDGPLTDWWVPVVTLVPLVVMVSVLPTLAGADPALESSTPRLRPRWRLTHAAIAAVLSAAVLAPAGVLALGAPNGSALVRNSLGVLGLALLAGTVLPIQAAWAPPMGYLLAVLAGAPHDPGGVAAWWAWPTQPGGTGVSWLVAGVLLAGGLIGYAGRGPVPTRPAGQD